MFDLEKEICNWRKKMGKGGITTPAVLDELESHLRDELEQEIRAGTSEERAFESAIQKIGEANLLKVEFKRATNASGLSASAKPTRLVRQIAALWLIQCLWLFSIAFWRVRHLIASLDGIYLLQVFWACAYLMGIFASAFLFFGDERGRRGILTISFLTVLVCVDQICEFKWIPPIGLALGLFALFSIWNLRSPLKGEVPPKMWAG